MKKIIFAIALLTACNAVEPTETMEQCIDTFDAGYDAAITDMQAENAELCATVEQLKADLDWAEFRIIDENEACNAEVTRLTDLTNALYYKIQKLEKAQNE